MFFLETLPNEDIYQEIKGNHDEDHDKDHPNFDIITSDSNSTKLVRAEFVRYGKARTHLGVHDIY